MTLLEVLIALFVMGIGMLAVLTLFPLGALSMAQSLQQDRAAAAAALATEYAEAMGLRNDPAVVPAFTAAPPGYAGAALDPNGPSWPVLVDAFGGANLGLIGAVGPNAPGISRVRASYAASLPLAARWFSLTDDVDFGPDARPSGGRVQRGGRYTWAYLLRRPRANDPAVVDGVVIVYSGRDTQRGTGEVAYTASGTRGETNVTLNYTATQGKPALRRNAWVLDVTFDTVRRVTQGHLYRVVNVAEAGGGTLALQIESPLLADVGTLVVLDNAVEVVRMGAGRSP